MQKKIFATALMLILQAVSAFGKELTIDQVRDLQNKIKSSDTLTMDFTQQLYTSLRKKTVSRKGRAIIAKPNRFRWMLETPIQEQKIFDGKYFYDYHPKEKSANRFSTTGPTAHELQGIVDLVLNFDTLLKRYDLVKAEQTGDEVKIFLKPKAESDVTEVELRYSLKASCLTYLRTEQKNKNSLTHEFSNPDRKPVPDDTFAIPAGVKVTDSN